jgi:hypothetical protein
MAEFDVFLSYSSADLASVEQLEAWLQGAPHNRKIWRDRRGVLPGAPNYYPPIQAGITDSSAFVMLLSPSWLNSRVAPRELSDAQVAGKKLIVVVHPEIPRDPKTPAGLKKKAALEKTLLLSALKATLEPFNWVWPRKDESGEPDYVAVEEALALDHIWAARHRTIDQRLKDWRVLKNDDALLRDTELKEIWDDAFANAPDRAPVLTPEQRDFLLASQRHNEALERERVKEQARVGAATATEKRDSEPSVALLLAAEAASVAAVPETQAILLWLLHRHAKLTNVIHGHGTSRLISGVAFSRDGRWLASSDRARAIGDDRQAHLLIRDAETARECKRIPSEGLTAVAWGERWLAAASQGSIGWLRWDDFDEKFRGNTPTSLEGNVTPSYLAFSPSNAALRQGEVLAWGTEFGDIGLIRVGDHVRWQGRLGEDRSAEALTGLSWLADGRLITAEGGRLLVRPFPDLEPVHEISAPGRVFSLACDGEQWVAACARQGSVGLLSGIGEKEERFLPASPSDLRLIATWAGSPADDPCFVTGSEASRSGAHAVTLRCGETVRETLLQGGEEPIASIGADPSGRLVAAGEMGGRIWLWDRDRCSHLVSRARPGTAARCLAASTGGHIALVTQQGRFLKFSQSLDSDPMIDMVMPFLPSRLLFADGGRILLVIAEDGRAAAVCEDSVVHQLTWPGESVRPRRIAAASNAPIIAVQSSDYTIEMFRVSEWSLSPACTIDAGTAILGLYLDPAGQRVYAAVQRPFLDVVAWRVDAPGEAPLDVATMKYGFPPPSIAFPDGQSVVIGDELDLLFVPYDAPENGKRRREHDEPVRCIAAGPNFLASVACWLEDTQFDQMRLWTADGQPLGPVTLPEHAVDIVVCPDGNSVLALGQSGALWRVTLVIEDWIDRARRIAGRSLTPEEERRHGVDAWRANA